MIVLIPVRAIEVKAILGQTSEVADAKIAAARGPVLIVGRGFTEVVVACPHKLTDDPWLIVLPDPVIVGQITPRAVFHIVAAALAIGLLNGVGIVSGRP